MFKIDKDKFAILTHDGKKLPDVGHISNSLMLNGGLHNNKDYKLPDDFSLEYEIGLIEDKTKSKDFITFQDIFNNEMKRNIKEYYDNVWKLTENILRNYVTPPIKGEITKGKVRWRGLQLVWQETDSIDAFVGVRQRDTLIFPDGKKIPWDSLVYIDK